ncbi:VanZ family protein [Caldicellulosiruptor acetigenus I77R1B]|uniref:VanZ family protein n=1 Tax=Caldicellulosiruptor acetigenus (strain ATCC 700853 / DSM 12137 / I77R1B) TaxID=632335 RepID=E4S722_CALA7|nr:VanZ family protein [Caldicellulosiruptor acetigenus]ADQ39797.1 VanZ family protein [Caldicellulosiruptor acetigenus I77R1B]
MNSNIKLYIRWALVFLWMAVIFYFSSQEGIISHQKSFSVAVLCERIVEFFAGKDIITNANRKNFEFFVRKLAHVTEYFVLCMLFYRAFLAGGNDYRKSAAKSFIFSFLYAVTDEIHQIFVAGRGPSPVDVGVDTIGMLLYLLPRILKEKIKKRAG